ncbi:hypothetical protein SeMB42_g05935 [Synchytrium endobioticum]|uniref:Swiss Army Knife RNA repair protein HAD domain-containing protein n=1 Tax=Synchytrium endobioticum TaxID=286115 RepID=A0A507CN82_9FUNG|nr:hypothetical protein SeMB42_g05935 [Synchytrium endobioticum]TPX41233.1 hypothetical protein SeLEV6574_g06197 [Synchytrium endobioticum]
MPRPHYERLIEEFSRKHFASPESAPLDAPLADVEAADIGDIQDAISQIGFVSSEIRSHMTNLKIFDFDSTLFRSPLPNPNLWSPELAGLLISDLGWFTDPRTLGHPGIPLHPDIDWFDRDVVKDALSAMQDPTNTLAVLLTGRRGSLYGDRVVEICMNLKPDPLPFDIFFFKEPHDTTEPRLRYPNTINFKLDVLSRILEAFPTIKHVEFWEDRPKHIEHDPELKKYLELRFEEDLVNDLVNKHNARIPQLCVSPATGLYSSPPVTLVTPVEIVEEVKYTGIMLDRSSRSALLNAVPVSTENDGCHIFQMVPNLHVMMYLGHVESEELAWIGGLGAEVSLQVIKWGIIPNKIIALQLGLIANNGPDNDGAVSASRVTDCSVSMESSQDSTVDSNSNMKQSGVDAVALKIGGNFSMLQRQQVVNASSTPPSSDCNIFILPLYVAAGSKPHDANNITEWQNVSSALSSLAIKGIVFEKRVTVLANHRSKHSAHQQLPNAVSIGSLITSTYPSLKGKEVGLVVRLVQAWMKRDGVENAMERKHEIQKLIDGMRELVTDKKALETEVDAAEDTANDAGGKSLQRR